MCGHPKTRQPRAIGFVVCIVCLATTCVSASCGVDFWRPINCGAKRSGFARAAPGQSQMSPTSSGFLQ
eukprot:11191681-Lingulodinium_polyedra.AAC.1